MPVLVVYGSDHCPGWKETRELLGTLREDSTFVPSLEVRLIEEHPEAFARLDTVVCPAFVWKGEVIHVGPADRPTLEKAMARADPS